MPTATPNWPGSTPKQAADCCIFDQLDVLVVGFLRKSVRSPGSLPTPMSVARVAIGLVVILAIVAYSAYSVITTGQVLGIDARLFLVVAPILAAVSWAAFNIGRAAVGQLQLLIKRSRA